MNAVIFWSSQVKLLLQNSM